MLVDLAAGSFRIVRVWGTCPREPNEFWFLNNQWEHSTSCHLDAAARNDGVGSKGASGPLGRCYCRVFDEVRNRAYLLAICAMTERREITIRYRDPLAVFLGRTLECMDRPSTEYSTPPHIQLPFKVMVARNKVLVASGVPCWNQRRGMISRDPAMTFYM